MIDFAPRFAALLGHIDDAVNFTSQLRASHTVPPVVLVTQDGTPVRCYFTLTQLLREIESLLYALAVDLEVARGVDRVVQRLRRKIADHSPLWPDALQSLRDGVTDVRALMAVLDADAAKQPPAPDLYSGFPRAPIDEAEREAVAYGTDMGCSWTSSDGLLGCNRLLGHDGDHVAVDGLLREILARWPRESTP